MKFEITPQRQAFLDARRKVVLNACPGSGKTTAIAQKIMLLRDECINKYGRFSGIACLSFTNTAKDEISEKYFELSGEYLGFPHKVSTIDSFINQHITLPYYYLIVKNGKRPKILDDPGLLNDAWKGRFQFRAKNNGLVCYTYPPASIRFESDGTLSSNGYRPSEDKVAPDVFDRYCKALKKWQMQVGLITTSDSAYIAHTLLSRQPQIGNWLALRFPHIIIDEAQDNSAIQHALFDKLSELGLLNLEFIGDPYQSLYEWRDADPHLFDAKYVDTPNWQGLDLTDNRRSPQRIIDCFSILRKQDDALIRSACKFDRRLPIIVYRYNQNNSFRIVQHFDQYCANNGLRNNQIVVRGNALKNQMLGKLADQEPWKSNLPYRLIDARHKYEGNEIKDAISEMRSIAVSLVAQGKDIADVKELEQELKSDNHFNATLLELLHDLPSSSLSVSDWTAKTQFYLKERLGLSENLNFEIKARSSSKFDREILNDPLIDHFKRPCSNGTIPITTVHQVKGKSLDSILVFFNEKKHRDNITFSDIEVSGKAFPGEKQRIIYVALSRPRHLLAMAFPDSISEEEIREKFGRYVTVIDDSRLPTVANV